MPDTLTSCLLFQEFSYYKNNPALQSHYYFFFKENKRALARAFII